ncbi:MAG: sigma-70 family RNA polymerase sigma factor [Myxococcales bacterium]|nr:sigma-70 family RNA polymerase sigma factor [Myxococcales bacterium]
MLQTTPTAPHSARAAGHEPADLAEFSRLDRANFGFVRGVLARLGVATAALDDAAQDVFLVVHRRHASFDATRALEPWLIGIARRIAFRHRRASARGLRALDALTWTRPPTATPADADRVEARQFLEQFLAQLGEARRQVFILGELHGWTGPEIARHLEIPVDTAYTRMRASRALLERALLIAAVDDPAPGQAETRRAWLLLLPQLPAAHAPPLAAWISTAITTVVGHTQAAAATVLVAAAAVLALTGAARPPTAAPAATHAPALATRPHDTDRITPAALPPSPAHPLPRASPRPHASTEESPTEQSPTEQSPTEQSPTEQSPTEQSPTEKSPTEKSPSEQSPTEQSPTEKSPTEQSPTEKSPSEQPSPLAPPTPARDLLGADVMTAAVAALNHGDPAAALARLDQHAREFPASALEQTRTLTRVRALCRLGRADEARSEVGPLRSRDPALVRDALAGSCVDQPARG